MSTLVDLQHTFAVTVAKFILWLDSNGYQVTGGEWWRSEAVAAAYAKQGVGISNSVHKVKLGIDLNIFKDGKLLSKYEEIKPCGDYWKTLNPLARWGGDFKKLVDCVHFSFEYQGVK